MRLVRLTVALPALVAAALLSGPATAQSPAAAQAGVVSAVAAAYAVPAVAPAIDATAQQVITATNAKRAAVGAGPLSWSTCLQPFSQRWATTLAGNGALTHQDLNPLLSACSLTSAGENVAMGYTTAASVVTGWMNSPGHRANMLDPLYTTASVAIATDSTGRRFWVMNFGAAPRATSAPRPTPTSSPSPTRRRVAIPRTGAASLRPVG